MKLKENQKEVFAELFDRVKAIYPGIKASPDELDPVVRMLLHAFAGEIADINHSINDIWESMFDQFRDYILWNDHVWSIPAATVCKATPTDNKIIVGQNLKLVYQSTRTNEPPLFFSPLEESILHEVTIPHMFCFTGNTAIYRDNTSFGSMKQLSRTDDDGCFRWQVEPADFHEPDRMVLVIGIHYDGPITDLAGNNLYISGPEDICRMIQQAALYHAFSDQPVRRPKPHLSRQSVALFDYNALAVGNNVDFQQPFRSSFLQWPDNFLKNWQRGVIPYQIGHLAEKLDEAGLSQCADESCYWMEIVLPESRSAAILNDLRGIDLNCFVTINREEVRYISFWGDNRNMHVTLPEDHKEIYRIDDVYDSDGTHYHSIFDLQQQTNEFRYNVHVKNKQVNLEIHCGDEEKSKPEKVTVVYSRTRGRRGNGVKQFLIEKLYQSHPGVGKICNLTTTTGGVEATSVRNYERQFATFMKTRGQVTGDADITVLAEIMGLKVQDVNVSKTVLSGKQGPFYGNKISIRVENRSEMTDAEVDVCRQRLATIIDRSSPINVKCQVEIV